MTIDALDLKDFWPISLVAWRLEKILDNVVSESQNEFVGGREVWTQSSR